MKLLVLLGALAGCGSVVDNTHADATSDSPADTPPNVTITSMPMSTDGPSAMFAFTADKPSTFQCALDTAAAADCTSPTTYMNLATGSHTFHVTAKDAAGSTGSAMYTWQVAPPCSPSTIEAESVANHPGWTVASGSVLHGGAGLEADAAGPAVQFAISFTATGLVMYSEYGPNRNIVTVAVDNGAPVNVNTNQANTFSFQIPNTIVTGLPNVTHTATVTCTTAICAVDYFAATCN